MKRREFVKRLPLTAIASVVALEELFAKQIDFSKPADFKGTVGVIGAGAAGMYAAKLLQSAAVDYKIFEATSVRGGRVRPLMGFSEKHIELGAEFIHGSKSMLYEFAHKRKLVKEKDPVKNRHIFFHYDGKTFHGGEILFQPGIVTALRFKSKIEKYKGEDITIAEYLKNHPDKFPKKIWPLVNAFISNTEGTSINRMGMYSFAKETLRWHSGDDDYNASVPLLKILEDELGSACSDDKIIFNCPVKEIDHSGERIQLTDDKGQKYFVDKLIITVSLNVLKSGTIKFTPPLPGEKTNAMNKIGMDGGMKIFLKFKEPFIKGGPVSLVTDGAIPLMWRSQPNVYTVFVMGEKAEQFSEMGNKVEGLVMDELNTVFNKMPGKLLTGFHIQDWLKEPFVKGGYSYAAPGTEGQREKLAASIDGKLFFAGEATNYNGHNASVHGAMETSIIAVKEILKEI